MRNLFMTEVVIELAYTHVVVTWQTSGEEGKTSVTQKKKSKGICMEGHPEEYHFLLFFRIHN